VKAKILEQLSKLGSLSHVFALTYNVDLVFVERWLVPALRKCGHPTLSIVADAARVAESFSRQRHYAPRLGKRYRVAPLLRDPLVCSLHAACGRESMGSGAC